jgi:hypothetical protein
MLQSAVQKLVKMGPAPSSEDVSVEWLKEVQGYVEDVQKPVSDEEARALAKLFGPDECFGFGWAILHIIETAPGWPLKDVLEMPPNEWIENLRQRVANAKMYEVNQDN